MRISPSSCHTVPRSLASPGASPSCLGPSGVHKITPNCQVGRLAIVIPGRAFRSLARVVTYRYPSRVLSVADVLASYVMKDPGPCPNRLVTWAGWIISICVASPALGTDHGDGTTRAARASGVFLPRHDVGSPAGHGAHQSVIPQHLDGLARGGQRHAELLGERLLAGQPRRYLAGLDPLPQDRGELPVGRLGQRVVDGHDRTVAEQAVHSISLVLHRTA
jgi:hypothetical protein